MGRDKVLDIVAMLALAVLAAALPQAAAQLPPPRLWVTYHTLVPTAAFEATGAPLALDKASILAQSAPHALLTPALTACQSGGGSAVHTIALDGPRNALAHVTATEVGGVWQVTPPAAASLPAVINVYFVVTSDCSVPGKVTPLKTSGRVVVTVLPDPCDACLAGCVKTVISPAPNYKFNVTCTVYASFCPPTWPATSPDAVGWAVSAYFPPTNGAGCGNTNFALYGPKATAAVVDLMHDMYVAGGAQTQRNFGVDPPLTVAAAPPVCADPGDIGKDYGVVQIYVQTTPEKSVKNFLTALQNNWHRRNVCSNITVKGQQPAAKNVSQIFCTTKAAPAPSLLWAGICIKGANPKKKYKDNYPVEKACFPGDALVSLADPETGLPTGAKVPMSRLAIGDVVECLKPAGLRDFSNRGRDDEQTYVRGACHVFNYHDAAADVDMGFVALHYTDAAGRPAKLRASKEHLVYVTPNEIAMGAPSHQLPPGGTARRADMVAVGDLLAVQVTEGEGAGGFVTARVTRVTTETHRGAFAPLLSDAGLLVVDGAAAFVWAHLPEYDPHPMQNAGEYYRHIRLWSDYFASRASGCKGEACPCLDAPDDPTLRCVRYGDKLSSVPPGLSDFAHRTVELWLKASEEGRTYWDYETGIRLGRTWDSVPFLRFIQRMLGTKPHTIGMLATDWLMVKPKGPQQKQEQSEYPRLRPQAADGEAFEGLDPAHVASS